MKKIALLLFGLMLSLSATAQTRWVDATQLTIGGHGPWASGNPYERLPSDMQDSLRKPLWDLGTNSSGIYVRFRSNSPAISAHWVLGGNTAMDHMTSVGIKGVALYFLNHDNKWQYVNTGRPSSMDNKSRLVGNMTAVMREYMMYLPLYERVIKVEIGVDSLAEIELAAVDLPFRGDGRPIVFYGTSIMQGACASRPGMNSSSILARRLGREAINLGFSGNAKLDYPMARIMARVETPQCFVLDFAPNCSAELIESNMAGFIAILRAKHPRTPIVVVEQVYFPPSELDLKAQKERSDKSRTLRAVYDKLRETDRNLYFVDGRSLTGDDFEATVDGLHATDLGFMRYADALYPVLKAL